MGCTGSSSPMGRGRFTGISTRRGRGQVDRSWSSVMFLAFRQDSPSCAPGGTSVMLIVYSEGQERIRDSGPSEGVVFGKKPIMCLA